jgi:hypothetical protein
MAGALFLGTGPGSAVAVAALASILLRARPCKIAHATRRINMDSKRNGE